MSGAYSRRKFNNLKQKCLTKLKESSSSSSLKNKLKWKLGWNSDGMKLFCCLLVFRLLNSLTIQTSYVPDEYWQSLEVAHNVSFKYGYLTWEWQKGIRSYLYPLIFSFYFNLLAILRVDNVFMMTKGPRMVQGFFAALSDFYLYQLSLQLSIFHKNCLNKKNKNKSRSYVDSSNKNETIDNDFIKGKSSNNNVCDNNDMTNVKSNNIKNNNNATINRIGESDTVKTKDVNPDKSVTNNKPSCINTYSASSSKSTSPTVVKTLIFSTEKPCSLATEFIKDSNYEEETTAWLSLLCGLCSWYSFYSSTRTLVNNMETLFVSVATHDILLILNSLHLSKRNYLSNQHGAKMDMERIEKDNMVMMKKVMERMVVVMVISTIIRPTTLINWVPLGAMVVWGGLLISFLKATFTKGLLTLVVCWWVDARMYGSLTNVLYNFLRFNLLQNQSYIYGTHPLHWYVSQGLPVVLFTHLLLVLWAVIMRIQKLTYIFLLWPLLVYSLQPHKEFRFLSSILPFFMHLCGSVLYKCFEEDIIDASSCNHHNTNNKQLKEEVEKAEYESDFKTKKNKNENLKWMSNKKRTKENEKNSEITKKTSRRKLKRATRIMLLFLLCSNIPLAFYFNLLHQRGVIDVVIYLSKSISSRSPPFNHYSSSLLNSTSSITPSPKTNRPLSIFFLMPCHSTPFYAYLHHNITLNFLTCEPNPDTNDFSYVDQADLFYQDPVKWLSNQNWASSSFPSSYSSPTISPPVSLIPAPTCLVMYKHLYILLLPHLTSLNLHHVQATFFHTHIPETRTHQYIIITCTKTR